MANPAHIHVITAQQSVAAMYKHLLGRHGFRVSVSGHHNDLTAIPNLIIFNSPLIEEEAFAALETVKVYNKPIVVVSNTTDIQAVQNALEAGCTVVWPTYRVRHLIENLHFWLGGA